MKRKNGKMIYYMNKGSTYEEAKATGNIFPKTFTGNYYKNTVELSEEESNDWEVTHYKLKL